MLTLASTVTRPQAVGCLKMADERTKAPHHQQSPVPELYGWPSLIKKDGDELFDYYRHTLKALGSQRGLLGLIFNEFQEVSAHEI